MARKDDKRGGERDAWKKASGGATASSDGGGELDEIAGECVLWPMAVQGEYEPRVFTREALRAMDRLAAEEYGLPTLLLMENAGACLAAHAKRLVAFDAMQAARESEGAFGAVIVAGKGNNGGDGLVMARHLVNAGWRIAVVLAAEPAVYEGDAAVNLRIIERMGVACVVAEEGAGGDAVKEATQIVKGNCRDLLRKRAHTNPPPGPLPLGGGEEAMASGTGPRRVDVIVDALFGTGLVGEVRGVGRSLIEAINEAAGWDASDETMRDEGSPRVQAVDIPSGLDADRGEATAAGGPVVRADITVSLVGMKPGYLTLGAQRYLGRVVVAEIGMPAALLTQFGTAAGTGGVRHGESSERTERRGGAYRPGEG